MINRHIGFTTLLKIVQYKDPRFLMGIIALLASVVTLLLSISLSRNFNEPYENYDHEVINANGVEQEAIIVNLQSKDNVEINGKNPLVITYLFDDRGVNKIDKFKTLNVEKGGELSVGDKLKIKTYNGASSIIGYESFTFPFFLILLIAPVAFFLVGVMLLLRKIVPAIKIYRLYKNGIVHEAEVHSILTISGTPITNKRRKVSIDYFYRIKEGEKKYGNTASTDFSLLAEMKAGDKVKIFISEDGKHSCLIPKKEAIKNNWNITFA
ncbi:hypothetical protein [Flavobacterium sp. NRK1]|uniref:hypothetical protein n=1 Tax=Flavobacterium sp. NRK1 TaxID=2954929 RepID=UPI00209285DB|nr:hypothetical protein [Flavobacterium sp. NRK1]MCO6146554.1 hypothetical protein [Flavobacterium sp. NRK1]